MQTGRDWSEAATRRRAEDCWHPQELGEWDGTDSFFKASGAADTLISKLTVTSDGPPRVSLGPVGKPKLVDLS